MINNEDNNKQGKTDEEKDNVTDNLSYNTQKDSYELDVDDDDPDYDHPADYDTLAEGAEDDDSTYDDSNPFVGDEYADEDDLEADDWEKEGMHETDAEHLRVSRKDQELSRTAEDLRDDLDEEGYPKND